jgi:hypothetical protein
MEARDFSHLHSIQIGRRVNPVLCAIDARSCFPLVEQPGHETDYTFLSSAKMKKGGTTPPVSYSA